MRMPAAGFTRALVTTELPELSPDRVQLTVAFVLRRLHRVEGPMAVGVGVVAGTVALVARLVGSHRLVRCIGDRPLPLVGEYARLVRSLAFAYIWETWPDTTPTGAAP